jgi:hypothetical protein
VTRPLDPDALRQRIARTLDETSADALRDGVVPKKCGLGAFVAADDEASGIADEP